MLCIFHGSCVFVVIMGCVIFPLSILFPLLPVFYFIMGCDILRIFLLSIFYFRHGPLIPFMGCVTFPLCLWIMMHSHCVYCISIMSCVAFPLFPSWPLCIPIMGCLTFHCAYHIPIMCLLYSHHGLCYIPIVCNPFPPFYSQYRIIYSHHVP